MFSLKKKPSRKQLLEDYIAKPHETHQTRILKALKRAGKYGLWTHELALPSIGGHRFSHYVRELRKEGYVITKDRVNGYEYKYYLNPGDK